MSEPWRDEVAARSAADQADEPRTDADAPGPGLPPPTAVESLVGALLEAGPEVAEHVVRAAQELLLAMQVIVDAAEQAVEEQQELRGRRAAGHDAAVTDDTPEAGADAEEDADDDAPGTVRHLDVAE